VWRRFPKKERSSRDPTQIFAIAYPRRNLAGSGDVDRLSGPELLLPAETGVFWLAGGCALKNRLLFGPVGISKRLVVRELEYSRHLPLPVLFLPDPESARIDVDVPP
jgi:hypothetical protein